MRRLAIPLVLAVLVPAGCGGGGTLSAGRFAQQADAICADFQQRIDALGTPTDDASLPALVDGAEPILEDGLTRLRALKPPEQLRKRVETWLRTGDRSLELLRDLRFAARTHDAAAVRRIVGQATRNNARGHALARALGMRDCAKG